MGASASSIPESEKQGAGLKPAPMIDMQILLRLAYAFLASFNPRSAFSGLNGSLLIRTPTRLQMAFTMAPSVGRRRFRRRRFHSRPCCVAMASTCLAKSSSNCEKLSQYNTGTSLTSKGRLLPFLATTMISLFIPLASPSSQ